MHSNSKEEGCDNSIFQTILAKIVGTLGIFWKHCQYIYFRPPLPLLNVDFELGEYTVNGCAHFQHCLGGEGGEKIEEFVFIVRRSVTRVNSSLVSQVILARL